MRDAASRAPTAPAPHPILQFLRGSRKEGTEDWHPGDIWVLKRSDLKKFKLSLTGAGFLLFMFVILTFRVDLGDVAVALALIGIVFQRGKVVAPGFLIVLALFVGWCVLGLLTTDYPLIAQRDTLMLTKLALIWFAALNALRTRSQFRFFLIFAVVLYATHPIRGAIFNSIFYGQTLNGRFVWEGAFGNSNGLAALTIPYLSMAAALLVGEKKGMVRWGALASVVTFSIVIVLTQSRGGLLGFLTFGLLVFWGQRKRARMLLMVGVFGAIGAFFVPDTGWARLGQLVSITTQGTEVLEDLDDSGSARERFEILRVASTVISDHPITGVGWGAYARAHYDYVTTFKSDFDWFRADRVKPMDAHNTPVAILAETGIVGFGLFFLALGLLVGFADRTRRRWGDVAPLAARQIAILQYGFYGLMVAGLFATLSGLAFFYIHLTVLWVAAAVLDEDMKALMKASRAHPPGTLVGPAGPGVMPPGSPAFRAPAAPSPLHPQPEG